MSWTYVVFDDHRDPIDIIQARSGIDALDKARDSCPGKVSLVIEYDSVDANTWLELVRHLKRRLEDLPEDACSCGCCREEYPDDRDQT